MTYSIIIPARLASTRLPEKPLADLMGKPLIQHVWERANESQAERVIIATDHPRVNEACKRFDAEVVMTSAEHQSGTDRLQEVCEQLGFSSDAIVVNLQGDEPLFPAKQLDQLSESLLTNPSANVATLCCPLDNKTQLFNPNVVKVVRDSQDFALYFSRAAIPFARDTIDFSQSMDQSNCYQFELNQQTNIQTIALRHLGVYAYRVNTLHQFVTWPMGQLEGFEKLEQLRVLENGGKIHCATAAFTIPEGVDTPEDLENVRDFLKNSHD